MIATAARRAAVAAARRVRDRRSVILAYHGVQKADTVRDPGFLCVDPEAFRAQVALLQDAGFEVVTVAELARRSAGGVPPAGMVALSFDDGMEDNHSVLLPILRERCVPATVYVISGLIGRPNPWMGEGSGARMMTEPELQAIAAAGVELGAHTVSHPDLEQLGYDDCLRELEDSKREVERIGGAPVTTFAYPYCKYGDAARRAARDAGFAMAVTCHRRGGWDPWETQRTMISGKDGMPSFVLKLVGAYEPLFASVPGTAVRAGTRSLRAAVRRARERRGG